MGAHDRLQAGVAAFVREFGLLQPDRTPCGRPISVSMAHALGDLAASPGLAQQELAARLRLEKSTVSRLVAELDQRGWIERRRDERDGRVHHLFLTAAGAAQAERLEAARAARFAQLAARLTDADRVAVEQALDTLVRALQPDQESVPPNPARQPDHHHQPDRHRQPDPPSGVPR